MCCHFAWVCMYVCMYVYPQLAQCNSMLVCVCPSRFCTMLAQQWGQNVPRGWLRGHGLLPCLCGPYLMENTTTSVSSLCPAHCTSHTISVTLWRHTLMFAECVAHWTIRFDSYTSELSRDSVPMAARAEVALVLTAIPTPSDTHHLRLQHHLF